MYIFLSKKMGQLWLQVILISDKSLLVPELMMTVIYLNKIQMILVDIRFPLQVTIN